MGREIKVLVVDDSAVMRQILELGLNEDKDIKVIGKAHDVYRARDLIVYNKPDVITLDVEMPKMNGVDFLKRLMPQFPIPVIMVSSLTSGNSQITLDALDAGALDYVLKPGMGGETAYGKMIEELVKKIRAVAFKDVSGYKKNTFNIKEMNTLTVPNRKMQKVILIGASTGGTVAAKKILYKLPSNSPGIVMVQHMPAGFTDKYAQSIDQLTHFHAKEAEDEDRIETGKILIAPGDYHINIYKSNGTYYIKKFKAEKVSGHRPSVDVMFNSAAETIGKNAIGVLLTGMGKDGAQGLLNMKKRGAHTIAQDEKSSIVYGMPGEAYRLGAISKPTPLDRIPFEIVSCLNRDEIRAQEIEKSAKF